MKRTFLVALLAGAVAALAVATVGTGSRVTGGKGADAAASRTLVDLTHAFNKRTIYWPTAKRFKLTVVAHGHTEAGFFYAANNYEAAEHGGTHVDSPIHFAQGRHTTDEIPLSRLVGNAIVIDVSSSALRNRDYRVSVRDFVSWERRNGRIPRHAIVLLRTGYDRFWLNARQYLGTAQRGEQAVPKLHFPGLHPAGARWLVQNRRVKAVGIDTASIDYGQSKLFRSHQVLGAANVPVFENLANLGRLPRKGFSVIALPMKIDRGSGGPLRAIAIVGRGQPGLAG
ncbi:MAG: cyclase family protein [Actinomycetota bacterium]|nr:cyclase family protein [Actinomycetota bacterium]